jgi:hypothetical protein
MLAAILADGFGAVGRICDFLLASMVCSGRTCVLVNTYANRPRIARYGLWDAVKRCWFLRACLVFDIL